MLERLRDLLPSMRGERVVLSWGYAYQLMGMIPFNHMFVFEARRPVWMERVRRACERIGWGETPIDDAELTSFATTIEMDPDLIREQVALDMGRGCWSLVDTAQDDWGAAPLTAELDRFSR